MGEEVVASGQFLIDSEASLNGVLARLSHDTDKPDEMNKSHDMDMSHDMNMHHDMEMSHD